MSEPLEVMTDADGTVIINESGVPTAEVIGALQGISDASRESAALHRDPAMDAIVKWVSDTKGNAYKRRGGLLDRDKYVAPENIFDKMRVCYEASKDDIVASFLDSSEALAFSRIAVECDDPDETDIWQQICDDIDLDNRMREIWRELNIVSQAYVAVWFGKKSYQVRGKSEGGIKRKRAFGNLTVPLGLTVLDPFKVVPVGNFLFNQEILTYYADPTERDVIDSWLLGDDASGADPIIQKLIVAKYEPDFRDRKEIGNLGVDPNRLYILNPRYVWRHTTTRPGYDRFAPLRMESVFELLDLKHQLRAMDRANLIGASNFILLIKKGSDHEPAKPFEINALQEQVRTISKVPVIVGDHRLNIEIITPKTDNTLDANRYQGLDIRISGRLYGMFMSTHAGRDDSLKLARVVARGLESRRQMQRTAFMKNIIVPTYELNDALRSVPQMVFHPKSISLDFDPSRATYLLDLRDRGDLSRASILSEVDYDEVDEAEKRKVEKEKFDKIFAPPVPEAGPIAPGAGPAPGSPNDPKRAGRAKGGNHGKGGNGNVGRGAGQEAKPKPTASTVSYTGTQKGIIGQPKLQKKSPAAQAASAEVDRRSGMIALDVPPGLIPVPDGGVEDQHITVVYLGKDLTPDDFESICDRAQQVASTTEGPLVGTIGGLDHFPASESSDWKVPAYAVPNIPGIHELRSEFEDLNASQHRDFNPHMTLAYCDSEEDLPDPVEPTPVAFTHLAVHRGDDIRYFPFSIAA